MNKKVALTLTVLIGLAAIVVGFIAGTNFVTPQLGPSVVPGAKSCDGDALCETNAVQIKSFTGNERNVCISKDGKLYAEGINCAARTVENCRFSIDEAQKVVSILADSGENLIFYENGKVLETEHFVVPGFVLEVRAIMNSSSGFEDDKVIFINDVTNEEYEAVIFEEGRGALTLGAETYSIIYNSLYGEEEYIRVDFPQSPSDKIIYLEMCF